MQEAINKAKALINEALVAIGTPEELSRDELRRLLQEARNTLIDAEQRTDNN